MPPPTNLFSKAVIAPLETPTFTFTLGSFRITDTRSRHEDTDFVSFTLQLKSATASGTPKTLTEHSMSACHFRTTRLTRLKPPSSIT